MKTANTMFIFIVVLTVVFLTAPLRAEETPEAGYAPPAETTEPDTADLEQQQTEQQQFVDSVKNQEATEPKATAPASKRYKVALGISPGLASTGDDTDNALVNFSFNLLGGNYGYLKGLELGLVGNMIRHEAKGLQWALAYNYAGSMKGVQAAFMANVVDEELQGLQLAAFLNFADKVNGVQLASGVNIALGKVKGSQVSFGLNVALEDVEGLQLGASLNVGIGENTDAQVGLMNIAVGKVRAVQLGLINYADDSDVSIGLLSFTRKAPLHMHVWTSDTASVNLGIQFGSNYVYNILAIGMAPMTDNFTVQAGYGIGGRIPLAEKWELNIDVMAWGVHDNGADWDDLNILSKGRITVHYRFMEHLGIFAGPTFNVLTTDASLSNVTPIHQWKERVEDYDVYMWPGFVVGLSI